MQTTGPFKQLNQKSWQESFKEEISVHFSEMVHEFEEKIWINKRFFPSSVVLRFFKIFKNFLIKFNHEKALNQMN